jgi:outer membrane protein assembly factor BamB
MLACLWFLPVILIPPVAIGEAAYPQILWWRDLQAPSFGSAAVGDIDRDGKPEVVFGTYFNDESIYALNAEDGSILWRYDTGGCNDASPAIADVDLDGQLEVIAPASSPCKVYCFVGATGLVGWVTSTYPNSIDSPPAVADVVPGDQGRPEVIFGTFYGNVYALNGEDGTRAWLRNLGTNSYIQSEPNILDVDRDSDLDVVVAQWEGDYRIYALRGDDGSIIGFSRRPNDSMYHGGSFADIDEDGRPEFVIGSYDQRVYALNDNGRPLWAYNAGAYVGAPTSVADLNGDGHLEIVYAAGNRIGVLNRLGSRLWSYSLSYLSSIFRGAAIADIDGTQGLDVVFGASDGVLRVLRGSDGQVVWAADLEAHYGRTFEMDHAPVIADFDGDGKLDVFVVGGFGTSSQPSQNHGRAYCLKGGEGAGPGWPMFRHDLRHSGCFTGP